MLSRPCQHDADPLLHRALEKLKQSGRMTDLSADGRIRYLDYRREPDAARAEELCAYHRERYRRIMAAADPATRERLRALWRRQNQRRTARL